MSNADVNATSQNIEGGNLMPASAGGCRDSSLKAASWRGLEGNREQPESREE
jgi:hypothetical protein